MSYKKTKIALGAVGIIVVAFISLASYGKGKRNATVASICETRVKWQIGDRTVSFRKPVVTFVDTGSYLLHWKELLVASERGLMEPRKVMCTARYRNGWDAEAHFIDGEALR